VYDYALLPFRHNATNVKEIRTKNNKFFWLHIAYNPYYYVYYTVYYINQSSDLFLPKWYIYSKAEFITLIREERISKCSLLENRVANSYLFPFYSNFHEIFISEEFMKMKIFLEYSAINN